MFYVDVQNIAFFPQHYRYVHLQTKSPNRRISALFSFLNLLNVTYGTQQLSRQDVTKYKNNMDLVLTVRKGVRSSIT